MLWYKILIFESSLELNFLVWFFIIAFFLLVFKNLIQVHMQIFPVLLLFFFLFFGHTSLRIQLYFLRISVFITLFARLEVGVTTIRD